MATTQGVHRHNQEELKKFRHYLRMIPKVIALYAADAAIAEVMQPASSNYKFGEGSLAGKEMPHSSSNAAWNWRVGLNGEIAAPLDAKGKSKVVGDAYDERSTVDPAAAYSTVDERRFVDINKKLYNSLFSSNTAKMPAISIYNNLGALGIAGYTLAANLERATTKLDSAAQSGSIMSYSILNEFMHSGAGGSPNPEQLKAHLNSLRNSHFIRWL